MTQKFHLWICFLLLVFLPYHSLFAQRIGENREPWLTLNTPHFEIFYSAQHQDLSLYYAQIAELSYAEISTIFTVRPKDKIVVILNDSTDAPNGFATLIPYPHIMIFPVQAGRDDTLAESAEWAKELFVHELAHIFQLFPTAGDTKYFKYLLGNLGSPNLAMPLWWKEGMAVEIESRFSHRGRTKSIFQDASLRALVLKNKLFSYTLAQINESLPTWPYGGRPYLFGSMLMSQIGQYDQGQRINDITQGQAAQLPYFVEDAHKNVFGKNYESHFLETLDYYQRQAENQLSILKQAPVTETLDIDSSLKTSHFPRLSHDSQYLALIGATKKRRGLFIYQKNSAEQKWEPLKFKKIPSGDITSLDFHPSKNELLFTKIDLVNRQKNFSDIYTFNLQTGEEKKLTQMARGRYPIWNINGSLIYYISTFDGKTQLKVYNLITDEIENLVDFNFTERLHEISLYSESLLYLGLKDQKGQLQSLLFDINNRKIFPFTIQPSTPIEHFKKREGFYYFTSDTNGVKNIYRYNLDKEPTPVSHFLTGALEFDIGKNQEAVATVFTDSGLAVKEFKIKEYADLPVIQLDIKNRYSYQELNLQPFETSVNEAESLKYLYPQYWIPYVATSTSQNGLYFQLSTGGYDPLLKHRYDLFVDYDSYIEQVGYNFNYINSTLNWPMTFATQKTFSPIGQTQIFIARQISSVGFIPDTFKLSKKLSVNAGFQHSQILQTNLETEHFGPYAQLSYRDIFANSFHIYPASGWGAFLQIEQQKAKASEQNSFLGDYEQVTGSVLGYSSALLPEDHSIYGKFNFLHSFQKISTRFGTSNSTFPSFGDTLVPDFVLRGFSAGQFFGSRLVSLNTEYRFPLRELNNGSGTKPYFLKRLNGVFTVDGLAVSGASFDKNDQLKLENMSQSFWSTGAELRLESTLGYLLPVNFIFGYYHSLSPRYAQDGTFSLGLQIGGGFPALTAHEEHFNH